MTLSSILYALAYCIFIIGAARSYRDNGSRAAVVIMSCGVLLDLSVTVLGSLGASGLQMSLPGTNAVLRFAIALGLAVWALFTVALGLRRAGRMGAFHIVIAIVQVAWFIDFISFLYGMYKFPLQPAGL